jgi:nitrous oxidase accessory protein
MFAVSVMEGAKKMKKWLIGSLFLLFCLGRPFHAGAEQTLQQLIDAAPANSTIRLENKTYVGDIVIRKPLKIVGTSHTVIKGSGRGNVVSIKSPHVVIENVTITNSGKSRNTQEEFAAIKVYSNYNTLKAITVKNSFHGIYLSKAHHNRVERVYVVGKNNGEIGGQGNGLHIYYSNFNQLIGNKIVGTRDGIFFDYSNRNVVKQNNVSRTRYGLHYMYSDDNEFYENEFMFNTGGAAIMNSNRIILKNNKFLFNQGMRSFGVLLQMANDNEMANNEFYQNQRGVYIDQSTNNFLKGNTFLQNQIGVELWASSQNQIFTDNRFSKNITAVLRVGGEGNNQWNGNHWGEEARIFDLNQDGKGESPFEYTSSLHKIVEQNELAYLFFNSPSIRMYEKINELLQEEEVMAIDRHPIIEQAGLSLPQMIGWLMITVISTFAIAKFQRG